MMCESKTSCSKRMTRCFMTGELCTHQLTITRTRKRNFEDKTASVFVVMPFTDMADAAYKWIVSDMLSGLSGHFALVAKDGDHEIRCYPDTKKKESELVEHKVETMSLSRSDDDVMFGYIICNRVCQQIQIADIVVVDVSRENPNVFYEFGLSMAMGKMIIPICYEGDYYRITGNGEQGDRDDLANYPWKKKLFEFFSLNSLKSDRNIYYKSDTSNPAAMHPLLSNGLKVANNLITYASSGFTDKGFGRKIADYYGVVAAMNTSNIFTGDRIAVLGQQNKVIEESDKDDPGRTPTTYHVPDLILLGINKASRSAENETIGFEPIQEKQKRLHKDAERELGLGDGKGQGELDKLDELLLWVDDYEKHRGFLVYPNSPLSGFASDFGALEELSNNVSDYKIHSKNNRIPYTYFNAMLSILSYANEVVVDTQENDVLALFWLGMAHGHGAYAVRVLREYTPKELQEFNAQEEARSDAKKGGQPSRRKEFRSVFDVSGLWTAILRSDRIDGFFSQLSIVQTGIARHRRLLPFDAKGTRTITPLEIKALDSKKLEDIKSAMGDAEKSSYESYYRRRIWIAVLSRNKLYVDIGLSDDIKDSEKSGFSSRMSLGQWDLNAVSLLTNYISSHTMIGEYCIDQMNNDVDAKSMRLLLKDGGDQHSISIGDNTVHPRARMMLNNLLVKYECENLHLRLKTKKLDCPFLDSLDPREVMELKYKRALTAEEFLEKDPPLELQFAKTPAEQDMIGATESKREVAKGGRRSSFSGRAFVSLARNDPQSKDSVIPLGAEDFAWFQPNMDCRSENCPGKQHAHMQAGSDCANGTCQFYESEEQHESYAQFIVYKERPQRNVENENFRILIAGGSGPATNALATLLIDEIHKKDQFNREKTAEQCPGPAQTERTPLTDLQRVIRDQLMAKFAEVFQRKYRQGIAMEPGDIGKLRLIIKEYLNHLVARFFVPILTQKDLRGLGNSLWFFISNLQKAELKGSEDLRPGEWRTILESAKSAFNEVFEQLSGVEVMFKVDIKSDDTGEAYKNGNEKVKAGKIDNRKATRIDIATYPDSDIKAISYIRYKIKASDGEKRDALRPEPAQQLE